VDTRKIEETFFKVLMILSALLVMASLAAVVLVVLIRGLPSLDLAMITQAPKGGYYYGKEGGVLNAILGSLCLGIGATAAALVFSLPVVFYLQKDYVGDSRLATLVRLALDLLWGIPSIVYGAFALIIMLYLGLRASLLAGIIALTLVELPIMVRAMDEVVRLVPKELKDASYAVGATRFETTAKVVWRQALPGIVTGMLLAFGRGIGDAASVLLTAGYTDYLPSSLMEPVASLPLAVFSQIGMPFPEVQQRAYAAGAILLALVLLVSVVARVLARRFERHVVR
jgi:phosphate transport system permease protein